MENQATKTSTNPTETKLRVRFARKPFGLDDVLHNCDPDDSSSPVAIELIKEMTSTEYDVFAENMYRDHPWLDGRGGYINHSIRSVVMVTAPDRKTLFVDPSGSAYGRYVGVAV